MVPSVGQPTTRSTAPLLVALLGGLGLLGLGVLRAPTAAASPFEVYGFGSRAIAMGGAMGAAARDHPAIYYNPANLTYRTRTHFGLAFTFVAPKLALDPSQPDPEVEPLLPNRNVSLTLGFNFPLGGKLDYRLAVGFALTVPLVELTRLQSVDPARPYFFFYQSLPDNLVIAPALGVRIMDWLRVGVGVQILAALGADFQVVGDLVRRRIDERSLTVDLNGAVAPIVGLSTRIGPFEAGLTFRDDLDLRYQIPVDFLIEGVGSVLLDVTGSTLYSPKQLNLGLSWTVEQPRLIIAADLTWALWGQAPSPVATIDVALTDEELRPNEETITNLFELNSDPIVLGAEDILIPRLGLEWETNPILTLRGGYFFRPSPIPDQTGYTNVLDAAAHVFSIGAGATFPDPLQVSDQPLTVDLHIQLTHLRDRLTIKDASAGAGFDGSFITGGSIWNLGVELRQDF